MRLIVLLLGVAIASASIGFENVTCTQDTSSGSEDGFPDFLVGVWGNEEATFSNKLLVINGAAFYFNQYGKGFIADGHTGYRIRAKYNYNTRTITFDLIYEGKEIPNDVLVLTYRPYDCSLRAIFEEKKKIFRRHSPTLNSRLIEMIGD